MHLRVTPITTTLLATLTTHCFGQATDPPRGQWVCITEQAAFSIRDTAEPVVFDGKMWLSNGYYYNNVLTRDLWSSQDGKDWILVNEATPYDGYSELVAYKGRMWAVKGSVWSSGDGMHWTQECPQTPFGVQSYGELVVFQDKMWQLGGGEGVWCSSDGKKWVCMTEKAPYGKRSAAAVAAFKGKLWVMGGRTPIPRVPPEKHYPECRTFNDVWCSADGAHWECTLDRAPWAPRMWFVAEAYAGRLWIIGGFDNVHGANFGDVWYTQDGREWCQFESPTSFSPRHEPTTYVYKGGLWVVAGNSWPLMNDVWRLVLEDAKAE
jgi:hypothetical protein